MSDFYQNGVITTLHRLGAPSLSRIEAELKHYARERPMALVLPCLHTEIDGSGLRGILEVLREVSYLHRIIVSVSGTTQAEEFKRVREFFRPLPEVVCVWGSGPTVGELLEPRRLRGDEPPVLPRLAATFRERLTEQAHRGRGRPQFMSDG